MVAGLLLLAGCGGDPAPRPTPTPTSAHDSAAPKPLPSASFTSSIEQDDKTFWMSIGGLPTNSSAETRTKRTAPMTFHLECDRGTLTTTIEFDDAPRIWEHSCADGMRTEPVGIVKAGTKVEIFMAGTEGTSYVADLRWP
ncbi:hypothetical protein GCM10010123_35000 [Pilimelia anulata]|uniref:Uncharacterized protein n=1 Tax=Pilimelia anulata TaxID=53371 RepID=A0A8J3BE67_9ACTN|nr:hypothetical protein GCM10010123_35000 [Pilimelia anulata]